MAPIDPGSGQVAGWAVGKSTNGELALRCWERAKGNLAAWGRTPQGLIAHHGQDPVYTSRRWLRQLLIEDGVVSYCGRGAKDNPRVESFWAHFKGENASGFLDPSTSEELEWGIGRQMNCYNLERRHSRLDCRPSVDYFIGEGFVPKPSTEIGAESSSPQGHRPG